jgi:hypothetical protein
MEDQLASMKLSDNDDPKTHLTELKEHFQLMIQHRNSLIEKGKYGKGQKSKPNITCDNCGQDGHTKPDCYSKGGGKEGQGPWQKKSKQGEKKPTRQWL